MGGSHYLVGDINCDGLVDMRDIALMCYNYGYTSADPWKYFDGYNPMCDLNDDGAIDIYDLALACQNFGEFGDPRYVLTHKDPKLVLENGLNWFFNGGITVLAESGQNLVTVNDAAIAKILAGDRVKLYAADWSYSEVRYVQSINGNVLTLTENLGKDYPIGSGIVRDIDGIKWFGDASQFVGSGQSSESDVFIKAPKKLTETALSGQKNVVVENIEPFQANMPVIIKDNSYEESNVIDTINAGTKTLTMKTNLAHAYTVSGNGKVTMKAGVELWVNELDGGARSTGIKHHGIDTRIYPADSIVIRANIKKGSVISYNHPTNNYGAFGIYCMIYISQGFQMYYLAKSYTAYLIELGNILLAPAWSIGSWVTLPGIGETKLYARFGGNADNPTNPWLMPYHHPAGLDITDDWSDIMFDLQTVIGHIQNGQDGAMYGMGPAGPQIIPLWSYKLPNDWLDTAYISAIATYIEAKNLQMNMYVGSLYCYKKRS